MLPLSSEHNTTSSPEHPALPEHASPASTGLPHDASQHPESEPPRKRSWLRIFILVLLIGGAIAFVTYRIVTNKPQQGGPGGPGGGGRRGAMGGGIVPVAYDVATLRTIPITLQALGTVTAYNTVTLKSRVDGQVIRVNFTEGQRVRKGQLLIEIDPAPYRAVLGQAQGNLVRDQANAALAQAQAQRYNQLYAAGVVSKESNQTQEATAGQAIGTVAADRATIQSAQVNVNYTRITSPIDGIVGLRQVDIGNIISASSSTGLVVITQVNPISVIFTLPEDQLPAVFEHMRGGRKLVAEAWDRSNSQKLATGSLLTVDNQIDTTTGTAKLKAVFDNKDSALYPNQFVNLHLTLENRPNSLVVPASAVQAGTNGSFVYVIDRTKGEAGPAAATAAPTASGKGAMQGGGAVSNAPGGSSSAPAAGSTPTAGGSPTSEAGSGARGGAGRGGRAGGAGAQGPQTNYPVSVVPVVIESTQGTDVILKQGLTAGQQVVTDGTEKLQAGSRVVPRPSDAMVAARKAQGQEAPESNRNPGAGDFSNGRGSDLDPAAAGRRHRTGAGETQAPSGAEGRRRRPEGAANQ